MTQWSSTCPVCLRPWVQCSVLKGRQEWWCTPVTSALKGEGPTGFLETLPLSRLAHLPVIEIKVKIYIYISLSRVLGPGSEEYIKYS